MKIIYRSLHSDFIHVIQCSNFFGLEHKIGSVSHPSSELTLWLSSIGRGGGLGNISTKRSDVEYCRILGEANGFMPSATPPIRRRRRQEDFNCMPFYLYIAENYVKYLIVH